MKSSPFKFLESYNPEDKPLFFGRDEEIKRLYDMVFHTNFIVVFGKSGVGKTSLVQCGLASCFRPVDRLEINIRRGQNLNQSLKDKLLATLSEKTQAADVADGDVLEKKMAAWWTQKHQTAFAHDVAVENSTEVLEQEPTPESLMPAGLVSKIYGACLRPVYLIFDQLEELFISGELEERNAFIETLAELKKLKARCVVILVMRQEYLSHLIAFERVIEHVFTFKLHVEQMDRFKTIEVVLLMLGKIKEDARLPAAVDGEQFSFDFEPDFPEKLVDVVLEGNFFVQLPYLQIYLEKLYRLAEQKNNARIRFTAKLMDELGTMTRVLDELLEELIERMMKKVGSEELVLQLLKEFVTPEGTKKTVSRTELVNLAADLGLPEADLNYGLDFLTKPLLLRPLEGDLFELAHDTMAAKILARRPRERRNKPLLKGNPYRGLEAFREQHATTFFGRERAVREILDRLRQHNLAVVTGASGTGKSSLVKAGVFPKLRHQGFSLIEIVRPGSKPVQRLQEVLNHVETAPPPKAGFVLMIDQFEELLTHTGQDSEVDAFMEILEDLLEKPAQYFPVWQSGLLFKIIITIRSDFEPQFQKRALKNWWDAGRYVVPPLTLAELEQVIERPAEMASCYFEPPHLVTKIANEIAGRATALPLLSFALSLMFEKSLANRRTINERIFNETGVVGSLQNHADDIYENLDRQIHKVETVAPSVYSKEALHRTMRLIMLRMVSIEGNEMASRQVPLDELRYENEAENKRVDAVLALLTQERLLTTGKNKDDQPYVEPAHDALLWSWTTLWDWKREFGSFNISLRERLRLAIAAWKAQKAPSMPVFDAAERERTMNSKEIRMYKLYRGVHGYGGWEKYGETMEKIKSGENYLWHERPQLSYLWHVLKSEDNWLNKDEAEFVRLSWERKNALKKVRNVVLTLVILFLAVATGWAFWQRNVAENNLLSYFLAERERLNDRLKPMLEDARTFNLAGETELALARYQEIDSIFLRINGLTLQIQDDSFSTDVVKKGNEYLLASEALVKENSLNSNTNRWDNLLDSIPANLSTSKCGNIWKDALILEKKGEFREAINKYNAAKKVCDPEFTKEADERIQDILKKLTRESKKPPFG